MDALKYLEIREHPLEIYSSGKVFINGAQGLINNECAANVCKVNPEGLFFNSAGIFPLGYNQNPAVSLEPNFS